MHQEIKISPDKSLFYRYNPQGDILAVRFEPRFDPGRDEPVADMPQVSLVRDESSGACLGLRIEGVQQMILGALVRDVFARLRPELESAGAIEPAPVQVEPVGSPLSAATEARVDAAPAVESAAPSEPAAPVEPEATAEQDESVARSTPSDEESGEETPGSRRKKKRRRRRRRGRGQQASTPDEQGGQAEAPEASRAESDRSPEAPVEPAAASEDEPAPADENHEAQAEAPGEIRSAVASVASALRKVTGVRDADQVEATDQNADEPQPSGEATDDEDVDASDHDAATKDLQPEARDDTTSSAETAGSATGANQDRKPARSDAAEPGIGFDDIDLHPQVAAAIAKMGFTSPTPIQEQAIPVAIQGRDVVGLAQTGTGKTLAFVAPALHRMLVEPSEGGKHVPRLLVLAPTRELTVQVAEEAERLSAESKLRVTTIYGGVSMGPQVSDLKRGVDVIVATPGRMLDHLRRGNVKLGTVETLVLDEADRMLDMGFLPDVRTILRFLPAKRQTLFFTATMPPEIESLSLEFQTDPATVEIARRKPPESIDQILYPVGKHLKAPLLVHLLQSDESMQSVLVFTERKIDADVLSRRLRQEGLKVAVMHGDRRQSEREKALSDLAEGRVQVLVATNVAARGLDIDDISHVVNYDVPQTVDEYVHRIGRTARAEAEGSAWTLVTVSDEMMISRIEGALEKKLPRVTDDTFDYDVPTPSWAKPSAKDVLAMLNRKQTRADRMRHLGRKR